MPLTPRQTNLLFEIYQVPQPGVTEVVGTTGAGVTTHPNYLPNPDTQLRTRLIRAIEFINQDEGRVERVGEILDEYDTFALDPSPIDREGYSFRAKRSYRSARQALYPQTGILWEEDTPGGLMSRG